MSAGTHPTIQIVDHVAELEHDNAALRELVAAQEAEIAGLREELRGALLLGEFTEGMPHIYTKLEKSASYTLTRTFSKTFANHVEAMQTLRLLRALLNPKAQTNGLHIARS